MPQIDGLRALAVLAVLYYHWMSPVWPIGHWGVRLFFVISGYLITKTIMGLRSSGLGLWPAARVFFVRRSLRLFPAYYLTLALGALFFADVRDRWPWYVGYMTNVLMMLEQRWIALTPTWSLAVEEQFYLLWFFAVMLSGPRLRLALLLGMLVAAPLTRQWASSHGNGFVRLSLWSNVDALAAGGLLYEIERRGWQCQPLRSNSLCLLMLGGISGLATWLLPAVADATALLMFSAVVWWARLGYDGPPGRLLSQPHVQWIGRISYGVYIYHSIVPTLLDWVAAGIPGVWRLLQHDAVGFTTLTLATVAMAQLSYRYFESPIRYARIGLGKLAA